MRYLYIDNCWTNTDIPKQMDSERDGKSPNQTISLHVFQSFRAKKTMPFTVSLRNIVKYVVKHRDKWIFSHSFETSAAAIGSYVWVFHISTTTTKIRNQLKWNRKMIQTKRIRDRMLDMFCYCCSYCILCMHVFIRALFYAKFSYFYINLVWIFFLVKPKSAHIVCDDGLSCLAYRYLSLCLILISFVLFC